MIILDTNVISELMRPEHNPAVTAWLDSQPEPSIRTTVVSVMEIRTGLLLLPSGRRRDDLSSRFETLVSALLANRILDFDLEAAERAADITVRHFKVGRSIDVPDIQIAAIALLRNATLATQNTKDFAGLGLRLVNPWEA